MARSRASRSSSSVGVGRVGTLGTVGLVVGVVGSLLLLLSIYSIRLESNFPPIAICSLILNSVYSVGSSSYRVLKRDLGTVVCLCFFTYTLCA